MSDLLETVYEIYVPLLCLLAKLLLMPFMGLAWLMRRAGDVLMEGVNRADDWLSGLS